MNAEKMTQKAMEALEAAHADAVRKGHPELTTLHLLQALLEQEHGLTGNLLGKMGKDPGILQQAVSEELGFASRMTGAKWNVI